MMRRWAALLVLGAMVLTAQVRLNREQLISFVKSSLQLGHQDKRIADFLSKVELTEKLDASTVEDLQGEGAGVRTMEALRALVERTRGLSAPAPKAAPTKPSPIPPPSEQEQREVLEAAREYARSYVKNLPDYLCLQVTRRYYDPSGLEYWQKHDVITTRLSYVEGREDYKVIMIDNQLATVSLDELGGATSTGEFGSMLKDLFDPETRADFQWERWGTLRGKRTHVYRYRVSRARSRYTISYERRMQITPGYEGLVYIDRDTGMVLRITMQAVDIPPSFPVQQAATTLDYDYTRIGDSDHLLPLKADVRMRDGRFLVKNEVEFRRYQKFSADAVITFNTDLPEPLPADKIQEAAPAPATPTRKP